MAKAIPLFRAVIARINHFSDTDSVKIVCRVTHAGLAGEDVHEIDMTHRLADPPLVALRLRGLDAIERLAKDYRNRLKPNEEVVVDAGTTILFTARGIQLWDGRSTFQGEPLHRLDGWVADSLSIIPKTKRLALVFSATRSRVQEAAAGPHSVTSHAAEVVA